MGSLPIHLGRRMPWPMSWNHLGASRVSMVLRTRWPRLWKKFSSSGSAGADRRGARRPALDSAAAEPRPELEGDVAKGVVAVLRRCCS